MVAGFTNGAIEEPGDESPLGVVGDLAVDGVLVLLVIADPGIGARLGEGTHLSSGRVADAFDLIGESFEVLVTVHETRPGNDQIVVVTGETFHHPKIRCQDFLLVIEGAEGDGTQALAVPGVEQFMADEAIPAATPIFILPAPAAGQHQSAVLVLKTTPRFGDDIHELVAGVGDLSPEGNHLPGQGFDGLTTSLHIPGGGIPHMNQIVGDFLDHKGQDLWLADQNR